VTVGAPVVAPVLEPKARHTGRANGVGGAAREAATPLEAVPTVTTPEPGLLDSLVMEWWAALDAAQSALRAAGRSLPDEELGERSRQLAGERAATVQQLKGLAHELHTESRLLRLLSAPAITRQMLALPSGVNACVFDLDGVLTTSASLHAEAWAETLDAFLFDRAARTRHPVIPFDRRHDYEDHIAGRPRLEGVRAFIGSRGISVSEGGPDDPPGAHTIHGIANRKNELLRRRLEREGVAAFAGSRCYLEAVRMLGLRRAVVSASANTQAFLEHAGLAALVETTVDGDTMRIEHLRSEPRPDALLAACDRLGVQPGETAVFATTPAGIAAARNAGARIAVGVDRDRHGAALRASDADLVVGDLTELLDR
jgi:beta-phosphoglucomutase-like phosphatase (HAD superfamily)